MSVHAFSRKPLAAFLVGVVVAMGCGVFPRRFVTTVVAEPNRQEAKIEFQRYEMNLAARDRQTLLTGFLLGGPMAELAVVHIDENGDRRLRVFAFGEDNWSLELETVLRPEVLFVDVANIGGRDRLITYEPGSLNWFDAKSATERALVAVSSNFNPPRRSRIPHVDITRDLDRDGRDDLVVPDVDGFWVFIQTNDGAFADPVEIGPPTDMSGIYGTDGYRYDPWTQSRVHVMDYNHDGRNDLVFWKNDLFAVHLQDENGRFTGSAKSFASNVKFDSDNLYSLAQGDMTGRILHSLTDMNGDGIADLVVYSLEGKRITSKRSAYEVHFGQLTPDGGTAFARDADMTLRSSDRLRLRKDRAYRSNDRIQFKMDRYDFNADGQMDVMITTIDPYFLKRSLWKDLKGAMGDDVLLGLEFYLMEDGGYPETPNAIRTIALDGVPSHREPGSVSLDIVLRGGKHESRRSQVSWPQAFNMLLRAGDVTGDGRLELFIGKNTPNGLDVFVGVPGPGLFARRPQDVPVVVPNDEEYVWLVDLNRDGKQDVVLHDPFKLRDAHGAPQLPPGAEPHRVTVLLAR